MMLTKKEAIQYYENLIDYIKDDHVELKNIFAHEEKIDITLLADMEKQTLSTGYVEVQTIFKIKSKDLYEEVFGEKLDDIKGD